LEFYTQIGEENMQVTIKSLHTKIQKLKKFISFFELSAEEICKVYVIENTPFVEM
jgi:hypothetical protein